MLDSATLKKRTIHFTIAIIHFLQDKKFNFYYQRIFSQLIASSSSIGANYAEALVSESKQDFLHKIRICRKEASETIYWLEIIKVIFPQRQSEITVLAQEATEFLLIFSKISGKRSQC